MANRSSRNPGRLAQFDATGRISEDVPSYAINTGQAAAALAEVAGGLSATLGKMADRAAKREGEVAGLSAGQEAGAAYLQQQAVAGEASGIAGTGPWYEQAKSILRKEEGFKDKPYWDVNAFRTGYGSDTTVTADGKVQKVVQGMVISRDDAERDLDYRLTKREGAQVQKQLGAAWERLPDRVKAGLASVGYNYGSLPANVVAAAKSGDIGAIASAVQGLSSNPQRRVREANIIRGAVAAPAKSGSLSNEPVVQPLSTAPLALRRDGTIRGEAFDDAALSSWGWRMQEAVSTDLFQAQLDHQDDPQAFAAASEEIRAKYAADLPADPQTREMFDKSFQKQNRAYAMNISARQEKALRDEQEASYAAGLGAKSVEIERQAQVLGANPDGDAVIHEQVTALQNSIDGAVAQGIITPARAEKEKETIAKTAAFGRIQGVYEALPTPERKQEFALEILNDWREGKGPLAKLPFADVKARSDLLFNDARALVNQRIATNKGEKARLEALVKDDVASIAASGKGLDPAASGLNADRIREIAGDEAVADWQLAQDKARKLYSATNGMEVQSTADITERLTVMKPDAGKPGYADDLAIWEAARKRAQDVLKERETDPLGQAARGGAIEIQAIDPSSAEQLQSTLKLRRQQRDQVAGLYQQPVPVFRPGEKELLTSALTRQPEILPAFAQSVRDVFGDQAPRVLSEISEDGPIIAHAAGLSIANGDASVANDVATTLAMKRDKVFTAKMPSQGEMTNFAATEIAGAMAQDPRTQGALIQTASILFEQMANQQGFDPNDLKTAGSTAQLMYGKALDRAAGGRTISDKPYGGFGDVNGGRIIVPSDMPKTRPQSLLSNVTQKQLDKLAPIATGNDFKIPISDIRNARLVSVGDGRYLVALGDPTSQDPRYLQAAGGGFWQLDIRALERAAADTAPSGINFGFTPWGGQ